MIFGLTGGIGSGKSTAIEIFRKKGAYIIDADKISRDILEDRNILNNMKSNFPEAFQYENNLDRKKLREIVFSNEEKLKILNAIVHPEILKRLKQEIEKNKNKKLVIVDVPLMYETGFDKEFKDIIVISAEKNKRIERIIKRDGCTKEIAEKIINSQMPQEEKDKLGKYVIYNNGGIEELEKNIDDLLEKILE